VANKLSITALANQRVSPAARVPRVFFFICSLGNPIDGATKCRSVTVTHGFIGNASVGRWWMAIAANSVEFLSGESTRARKQSMMVPHQPLVSGLHALRDANLPAPRADPRERIAFPG